MPVITDLFCSRNDHEYVNYRPDHAAYGRRVRWVNVVGTISNHYLRRQYRYGTNVSAVAYNHNIRAGANLLIPYKIYRVSGATLKKVEEKYRVGPYDFSWTINNNTLIQPCDDVVPTHLYCHMDTARFANLHQFADSENLQNVLGVVHAFEPKHRGFDSVMRDIVIMNAENMPMIFTLWNEFATTEGEQLAAGINAGNIIIAMRVRVTTFNGLSLSTKSISAILINPPMPEANELKQWYIQNRLEIDNLITAKAFTDPAALLPRPLDENIMTIENYLNPANNPLWFAACSNCQKKFDLEVGSDIRARIPIYIEDETDTIDGEELAGRTGAELKDAEKEAVDLLGPIGVRIKNHHLVCYVRLYQSNGQSYTIVRLYMDEIEGLLHEDDIDHAAAQNEPVPDPAPEPEPDVQLFTPSTKACLEEIASAPMNTDILGPSKSTAARSLVFGDDTGTSSSDPPLDTIGSDGSFSEAASASSSAVPSRPLKKPRN
ncbi:Unknown protein [Striga hermonthica]|uniref:Replication protein A 70 kDa DNA-binding subunit B n=1 Tax=Striga hermonthica TaxID=68872 RepID=A0A9N7MQR9_STRHE|nr:Unknown protein [Striga hermonthica]